MTEEEALANPGAGLAILAAKAMRRGSDKSARAVVDLIAAHLENKGAFISAEARSRARSEALKEIKARTPFGETISIPGMPDKHKAATPAASQAGTVAISPLTETAPQGEPERFIIKTGPDGTPKLYELKSRAKTPGLSALRFEDFEDDVDLAPPRWLIKGMMPQTGLGMLYGESGSGKTFLSVHAALAVAWGLPFFDHKVKQGGVLYIAAEAGASVKARIRAANARLKEGPLVFARLSRSKSMPSPERAPIRLVTEAPNLSRDGDHKPLLETIRLAEIDFAAMGSHLALVIIDTWHAAMGGAEENSSADAGHALSPIRDASDVGGFFTLIVHHPGKDLDKGARGTNALPAAVDSSIELRVPGREGAKAKSDALRRAKVVKLRDGQDGAEFSYKLPVIALGVDEDGDPWTTCVVEPVFVDKAEKVALKGTGLRLSTQHREILGFLRGVVRSDGIAPLVTTREKYVQTQVAAEAAAGGARKRETFAKQWKRALIVMADAEVITVDEINDQIRINDQPCESDKAGHLDNPL